MPMEVLVHYKSHHAKTAVKVAAPLAPLLELVTKQV